ncbi:MAG: hypothetical protein V1742_10055, partial [Pseudomonadota bacterium]
MLCQKGIREVEKDLSDKKMVVEGSAIFPSGEFEAPVSKTNTSTFKFPFTNLVAPFQFTQGILSINNLKTTIFGGALTGSGKVFVKESPIKFNFDTKGVNL